MICGDSSMIEYDLFQSQDGGSIPTSPLQFRIKECRFKAIRHIFEQFHYKGGHMGGGISTCLALTYSGDTWGGAVLGKPRHSNRYKDCIEIRRMACKDTAPKNTESYFLSKIIWFIKKNRLASKVLSYADKSVGHNGTIYKASNFKCIGETSPTKHVYWNNNRYHPRSLTIDRPYSYKLREAIKNNEAQLTTEKPKSIFIYEIKSKESK